MRLVAGGDNIQNDTLSDAERDLRRLERLKYAMEVLTVKSQFQKLADRSPDHETTADIVIKAPPKVLVTPKPPDTVSDTVARSDDGPSKKETAAKIPTQSDESGPDPDGPASAEPPLIRPAPAKKPAAEGIKISAKKPASPTTVDESATVKSRREPKKIPVKKPVPKKTAAKSTTKKPKKTSIIKSAKTPKKRKSDKDIPNTLEDELAIQLTPEEIDNFQIEKVDMEKLTHKVCDILLRCESEGMLQSDLYKKLRLSARNGARLSLKLERMGMVNRVKLLDEERWTYKLILKKTPVSTISLEDAPCLVCPVEQKCSLEGDISPRTCTMIEEWVMTDLKRRI